MMKNNLHWYKVIVIADVYIKGTNLSDAEYEILNRMVTTDYLYFKEKLSDNKLARKMKKHARTVLCEHEVSLGILHDTNPKNKADVSWSKCNAPLINDPWWLREIDRLARHKEMITEMHEMLTKVHEEMLAETKDEGKVWKRYTPPPKDRPFLGKTRYAVDGPITRIRPPQILRYYQPQNKYGIFSNNAALYLEDEIVAWAEIPEED